MVAMLANKRGDKVTTADGEGGVLVNGFDDGGYVMVEITFSAREERKGTVHIYHVGDLFDPTEHDAALIPAHWSPPPITPPHWRR